jgi:hypothetical protein
VSSTLLIVEICQEVLDMFLINDDANVMQILFGEIFVAKVFLPPLTATKLLLLQSIQKIMIRAFVPRTTIGPMILKLVLQIAVQSVTQMAQIKLTLQLVVAHQDMFGTIAIAHLLVTVR